MPSFGDSIFLFVLALILFGPKKLPELARQLGKLMAEFRRASNEFRSQMEDELRIADQAERQKQIAAIETAAPVAALATSQPPAAEAVNSIAPPGSHTAATAIESIPSEALSSESPSSESLPSESLPSESLLAEPAQQPATDHAADQKPVRSTLHQTSAASTTPLPIAVSGELRIMPPATGLPTGTSSLSALIQSVPHAPDHANAAAESATTTATEEALHG